MPGKNQTSKRKLPLECAAVSGVDTGFFYWGSDVTRKMGVSMFTYIGMIKLTMVVNSTNK